MSPEAAGRGNESRCIIYFCSVHLKWTYIWRMKAFLRGTVNQVINMYWILIIWQFYAKHSSWISLIMTTSVWGSYYNYLYFTREQTEAQRGYELVQSYIAKFMQVNALALRLARKLSWKCLKQLGWTNIRYKSECVSVCLSLCNDVFCFSPKFDQLYAYPMVPSEPCEKRLGILSSLKVNWYMWILKL